VKKYFKLLLVFLLLVISGIPSSLAQQGSLGQAPDFSLEDINQTTYNLSSYKDKKPVILFFWTTWCPFCRKEIDQLKNIYPDLQKGGWELFTINIKEPVYKVQNFAESHNLILKVLLDKDAHVASAYEVLGVPTYCIIDKRGQIVFKNHYFPKETYKQLILR
jgi:peroxiredoxin